MESCVVTANAKINLSLDVVGRRDDGYHLLEMVMQSVSLADTITLQRTKSPTITITCTVPEIPCDHRNIAYRSAALFLRHCGLTDGVSIHIEKRIPSQAGLGGGSSDGAAVLVGLNRLFSTGLSTETLCELGTQVGADIPFCIVGGTQLCRGIGEIMTPLPPLPDCTILLCKPPINVSTKDAFARIDNGTISARPDTSRLCSALKEQDLHAVGSALCNVFSSAIPLPEIDQIQEQMVSAGAVGACMSGSGSTVFGLFDCPESAKTCCNLLQQKYKEVYLAKPTSSGIVF
jgi:4-diphosphocytidyl-2-C-methyl-D-erythritol kinase